MLELLRIFVDNITPILIVAAAGYLVGRRFGIDPKPIGTIIFYLLSPSLVFHLLYTGTLEGSEFVTLVAATTTLHFTLGGIAYLTVFRQRATPVERANVIIATFCLNAANYGLSLISFAFGPEVLSRAAVVLVTNVTLNYTLGVYVASNGRYTRTRAMLAVLRTPTVYAVIAAFVLRGLSIDLPLVFARPVNTLADASIPMMLVMLGLQMGQFGRLSKPGLVATGVGLKLVAAPLVAVGIALLIGLEGAARTAFIVQASTPTAVLTLVFATEFDLDRDLALNMVMISTLLSPITLSVIILLLQ